MAYVPRRGLLGQLSAEALFHASKLKELFDCLPGLVGVDTASRKIGIFEFDRGSLGGDRKGLRSGRGGELGSGGNPLPGNGAVLWRELGRTRSGNASVGDSAGERFEEQGSLILGGGVQVPYRQLFETLCHLHRLEKDGHAIVQIKDFPLAMAKYCSCTYRRQTPDGGVQGKAGSPEEGALVAGVSQRILQLVFEPIGEVVIQEVILVINIHLYLDFLG